MIVFSTLIGNPSISTFGWNLLGITVAANVAVWLLSDWMSRRHVILRALLSLLGLFVILIFVIGTLKVLGLIGITIGDATPLSWVRQNFEQLSGWFESRWPAAVWKGIQMFWLVILALFGIGVFWKLGKTTRKSTNGAVS